MALSRESEQKNNGFFNHGLNFFKNRLERSSDDATHKRVATEADPYGHVGSTKSSPGGVQRRDYSVDPSGEIPEDEAASTIEYSRHYDPSDPFAEAYTLLHRYGMIRFESQREDGSWEVYGLEHRAVESEESATASNPYSSMEQPQAIDPSTQAILAAELARFTQNRKGSQG